MSKLALLMAGGSGSRMRHSGVETIKPLVYVEGIPLIVRNVQQLLKYGFTQIIISVNQEQQEIIEFAEKKLRPFIEAMNASLDFFIEKTPLGNIGSAKFLNKYQKPAIVVYSDNITALNLREIFEHHIQKQVAMTIAVHKQSFKMPFGEIKIENDLVYQYTEKPTLDFTVCSAISILDPIALQIIPDNKPYGISDLARNLIAENKSVSAFQHTQLWSDVNDHTSLLKTEAMIRNHADKFELWSPKEPEICGKIDLTNVSVSANKEVKTQHIDHFSEQTLTINRWIIQHYKDDINALKKARIQIQEKEALNNG